MSASHEGQASAAEINRVLDAFTIPACRIAAMEGLMASPLTPDARRAVRVRYLRETEHAPHP